MPYDDNYSGGFGGLGNSFSNLSSNPLFLAGIQMLGNSTPKIGAIPNVMEGVPTTLMAAQDRQRTAEQYAHQRQKEKAEQDALVQSLINGGTPEAEARKIAPSLPAIKLNEEYRQRQRDDAELQRYSPSPPPAPVQQPAQPAPTPAPTPAPQMRQTAAPDEAQQQALATASSKFDAFGQSSLNKTVAEVAAQSGNQTAAANFVNAARNQGLSPESKITGQVLSNPGTAMPLAKALGIGADLPDDQWVQAHADAFQASKARKVARAAEQQAQSAQQPQQQVPSFTFTQPGASPAVQVGPAQNRPQAAPQVGPVENTVQPVQQQAQAAAPTAAPQAPQTATSDARAAYAQNRIKELEGKLDRELQFAGSKNDKVSVPAKFRAQHLAKEIEDLRKLTPEYGHQPKYGVNGVSAVDAEGNPVMVQFSDNGTATVARLPDGVTISKNPIKLDGGDRWILLDPITRQKVAEIDKNVAAEAEQKATGKAQGTAKVALPTIVANTENMLKQIEEVENHPDKSKGVGPLIGQVGAIPFYNQDFVERVGQLQGQTFLKAYTDLKGGGAITEIEGTKGELAIGRLGRAKSETEFNTALKDLKDVVKQGLSVAKEKAGMAPERGAAAIPPPDKRETGKIYTSPDGRRGRWTGTGWELVQ